MRKEDEVQHEPSDTMRSEFVSRLIGALVTESADANDDELLTLNELHRHMAGSNSGVPKSLYYHVDTTFQWPLLKISKKRRLSE